MKLAINSMSLIKLLKRKNKKTLFTTPSHGQKFFVFHKFMQFYKSDISETDTHNPQKALQVAQEHAAKIYGTKYTCFLTNGSTSGVLAAVLTCVNVNENVLLWGNAHPCHLNAVKLAQATPVFYDIDEVESWGIPDKTSPEILEKYLKSQNIKAVIVTSPTYEGIVSDISAIKKICEYYGAYLIVDEAHGALYPFSKRLPQSAVNIADFCIQSLHKTAGGLNPTALLHSNSLSPIEALNLISTTSPSYPLLATIEANINFLNSGRGKKYLETLLDNIIEIKNSAANCEFYGDDITKINLKVAGMSGYELSEKLFNEFCIEDEKTNDKSTMLLCGIGTTKQKLTRLQKALLKL